LPSPLAVGILSTAREPREARRPPASSSHRACPRCCTSDSRVAPRERSPPSRAGTWLRAPLHRNLTADPKNTVPSWPSINGAVVMGERGFPDYHALSARASPFTQYCCSGVIPARLFARRVASCHASVNKKRRRKHHPVSSPYPASKIAPKRRPRILPSNVLVTPKRRPSVTIPLSNRRLASLSIARRAWLNTAPRC
jgi:hypothetical protein